MVLAGCPWPMLAVIFRVQILIAIYPVGLYIGPSSKLTELQHSLEHLMYPWCWGFRFSMPQILSSQSSTSSLHIWLYMTTNAKGWNKNMLNMKYLPTLLGSLNTEGRSYSKSWWWNQAHSCCQAPGLVQTLQTFDHLNYGVCQLSAY